jgi:hypothetical protein
MAYLSFPAPARKTPHLAKGKKGKCHQTFQHNRDGFTFSNSFSRLSCSNNPKITKDGRKERRKEATQKEGKGGSLRAIAISLPLPYTNISFTPIILQRIVFQHKNEILFKISWCQELSLRLTRVLPLVRFWSKINVLMSGTNYV